MKWWKCSLLGLALLFIAFTIWYHIPVKHEKVYDISTLEDDQTKQVTFKLKKHRSFFKLTVMSGYIYVDEKSFKSQRIDFGSDWISKVKMKLSGELAPTVFYEESTKPKHLFDRERWHLQLGKVDFSFFVLDHKKSEPVSQSDTYTTYVGPARTSEEAQQLYLNFL